MSEGEEAVTARPHRQGPEARMVDGDRASGAFLW